MKSATAQTAQPASPAHPAQPTRWTRKLGVLTLVALLIGTAHAAGGDAQASRFYEEALERYEKRDLATAITLLKSALQKDRKLLQVHVLLGKALLGSGQAAAAEVEFTEALQLGVNRSELVVVLARTLVAQGKLQEVIDQPRFALQGLPAGIQAQLLLIKAAARGDLNDARGALKDIDDARALAPDSVDVWLAEVPLRIRARQFKEAQAAVDKARTLDPRSAAMQHQFASILHLQGNLVGALAAYGAALDIEPDMADARVARAGILIDLKRDEAATQDVAELLRRLPLEPRGWYLSAVLAEREGKQQAMRASLAKITALLDPVPLPFIRYRPQVLLLNGQAHYGLGEREKAKPYFEGFQRLQPASPVAKLLANIYLTEGNYDRAAETLEQYLQTSANDSQATALLASTYMAKGRNARAAELMQRALRTNDAPELYTAYGLSLLGTGKAGDALAQLETAYKKDPGQTQAAYALVGMYLRAGQTTKALTVSQALVKRAPANPSFQNLLGLAKAQGRDLQGARAAFEQAVKLDPTLLQATLNLARLEMSENKLDRAGVLLTGVLKADERNTEAMYEQAVLARRLNKPDDALRFLQRAYDVADVKDLRSSLALVEMHLSAGRGAEALKVALLLSSKAPDSLPVLMALVRAQLTTGDVAGAKNTLSTATRVAPYEAPVQVEIALLQLAAKNVPGAAYNLDKALSAQPDHLPAQVLLTEVEMRQGELQKAEARAQQIVKRAPKLAIGNSLLGDLAMARKQPVQAVELYRRAFQLEPSSDTVGRLFAAQAAQNVKLALPIAEQWLKTHPKDVATRRALAEAHVRTANLAAARLQYEQLRVILPKDAAVANNLANVLFRLKDPQALPVAEQALALEPDNVAALDTTGWIAFNVGNTDRGLQLLRDARLRSPNDPEIRYHLSVALIKTGRKGEAREELRAALGMPGGFDGRDDAEAQLKALQ